MEFVNRSRLVGAILLIAGGFCAPAYSQKILSEGIKDLATQIATNVSKEKKQKIAILPFRELDGKPTILGTYISEELVTDLFVIGGLDIVERSMLDRLLGELKLGQTGIIDPETAKRVGKVAGVDAIVTGSITDLQSYVALNCRLIDAQTGRIFAAAQTKIVKDDDVRKIMNAALPSPSEETNRASASRSESPTGPKTTTAIKDGQQHEADNFIFELKRCSHSGTSVACYFIITNKGEDRDLSLYEGGRLFDEEGNEYRARNVILGLYSTGGGVYSSVSNRCVTGIPIKAQLSFEGIPPEAQRATLLELPTDKGRVKYRDVPLVRP